MRLFTALQAVEENIKSYTVLDQLYNLNSQSREHGRLDYR